MNDNIEIDNFEIVEDAGGGSYGKKDAVTYQAIIMNQLARITKVLSQDLIKGHWKTLPLKSGTGAMMMHEVYISDGRKMGINAIQCYYELLIPKFDAIAKKDYDDLMKDVKTKKDKLMKDNKSDSALTDYKLIIYRKLFEKLNLLVSRLGYFEEESGYT